MTYKVEIEVNQRTITKKYFATDLSHLDRQVTLDFPKGKIISIIGG